MNETNSATLLNEMENGTMSTQPQPQPSTQGANTSNVHETTAEAMTMDAAPTPNDDDTMTYYDARNMDPAAYTHNEHDTAAYMFSSAQANNADSNGTTAYVDETNGDEMTYNDGTNYEGNEATYENYSTAQEAPHHTDELGQNGDGTMGHSAVANDPDMDQLMKVANDEIQNELKHIQTAVKRVFKELLAFKTASAGVSAQWAPVLEAERQEAARLIELQAEVEGTVNMAFSHSN